MALVIAAAMTEMITPNLSIMRPMTRLPTAKPIILNVKGREVMDLAVSKSVSKSGIIVITAHMPVFANIAMIRVTVSLNHE